MSPIVKAALCAVTALCATPASAAVFTYSFLAEGAGQRAVGSATGLVTEAISGAAITFVVDVLPGDNVKFIFTERPITVGATTTGLSFSTPPGSPGPTSFSGRGEACFANAAGSLPSAAGTIAIDPNCGGLSFSQASVGGVGGIFSGKITAFVVTAGGTVGTFNARMIPAIPEPATWALMLTGFGMVGYAMRRRRPQVVYA